MICVGVHLPFYSFEQENWSNQPILEDIREPNVEDRLDHLCRRELSIVSYNHKTVWEYILDHLCRSTSKIQKFWRKYKLICKIQKLRHNK